MSEFHFRVRAKDAGGEGSTRRPVGGPYEVASGISSGRVLRDAPLRARPGPVPLQYQVPPADVIGSGPRTPEGGLRARA